MRSFQPRHPYEVFTITSESEGEDDENRVAMFKSMSTAKHHMYIDRAMF